MESNKKKIELGYPEVTEAFNKVGKWYA